MKENLKLFLEKINEVEKTRDKIKKAPFSNKEIKEMVDNCDNVIIEKCKKIEDYLK